MQLISKEAFVSLTPVSLRRFQPIRKCHRHLLYLLPAYQVRFYQLYKFFFVLWDLSMSVCIWVITLQRQSNVILAVCLSVCLSHTNLRMLTKHGRHKQWMTVENWLNCGVHPDLALGLGSVFTTWCICIARTMPWKDVCVSVCLSHVSILSKQLYMSLNIFYHQVAPPF